MCLASFLRLLVRFLPKRQDPECLFLSPLGLSKPDLRSFPCLSQYSIMRAADLARPPQLVCIREVHLYGMPSKR